MNLVALIVYGIVNVAMMFAYIIGKNRICEFPFWAGAISLGWFFPQAIGGYYNLSRYPDGAYAAGMFFASLCSVAMWFGYSSALKKVETKPSWLNACFYENKLYWAGAVLCCLGYFFQWKLMSLPEDILAQTQWTGAAVKYQFLSSVGKIGFLVLWFVYLGQKKFFHPRLLIFVLPGLLMLLNTALVHGRRAGMMNLVAYILVGLWFRRNIVIPRGLVVVGLVCGLTLINAIGTYRFIMKNKDATLTERFLEASKADYKDNSRELKDKPMGEFNNYVFYRQAYSDTGKYDYGLNHWNGIVRNFVPAQIVGRGVKQALMMPLVNIQAIAKERYGHAFVTGTTVTGYCDSFGSFGWLGFIKFFIIGWMMGMLYRHAMLGSFLGQVLYVYMLGTAMRAITHVTHTILVSSWIYFLALGYPVLCWAKVRPADKKEG